MNFSPSTWHALGLNVAAGYAALGAFAVIMPRCAAETFFIPATRDGMPSDEKRAQSSPTQLASDATATALMPLLGVRDLCMSAAMFAFAYQGQWNAVGTTILAGTGLCLYDCWVAYKEKGTMGILMAAGATLWTVTGWALVNWI